MNWDLVWINPPEAALPPPKEQMLQLEIPMVPTDPGSLTPWACPERQAKEPPVTVAPVQLSLFGD